MDERAVPRFHVWHRWSQWSEPELVKYVRPLSTVSGYGFASYSSEGIEVKREEQTRHCTVCNAVEVRRVWPKN